jgi:hypothetical protein
VARSRLLSGWLAIPEDFLSGLQSARQSIDQRADQAAAVDAQTFLTSAQLRLADYRLARQQSEAGSRGAARARVAYETYCSVLEEELNSLYDDVQRDFSTFYRTINDDDEAGFTAKLIPSEGRLDLNVNFYERGLFPPAAYHSEGHQDGMGVCLYLALMKRLFGEQFTFALLDDVVMSVDSAHRYQFCKLLKTHFAETQFVITTHDRLWAEQMKSAGLVNSKTSLAFHSWTIDTGPLVQSDDDIWSEIDAAVGKGKVEAGAAALRRHLEYVSRTVAGELSAEVPFRPDGQYELGDLLPKVLKRMKELLGRAADAAQSWGDTVAKDKASQQKAMLSAASAATNVEQWAVNKAVHYNEWANFGRTDFLPVVSSFKALLESLRCGACGSWLYATPRHNPESLRCACNAVGMNLNQKPKGS